MKKLILALSAAVMIMLSACNEKVSDGPGRLAVKITDSPFPVDLIDSAGVTITKIEIRKAGDNESNPFIVVSEDTMTLNLVDLRNGIVEALPEISIPQGNYDLVRLYVSEARLKVKDGGTFSVKVPSGQQTGIKVFITPGLAVEGGLTSELLLDFDLSGSFVVQGNPMTPAGIHGFIFKPVIKAVNTSTAGRIEGVVTDTFKVKIKLPVVWIKQDTIVATAIGDTLGHYAFLGVKAGTYSIYATKAGYDTVVVNNLVVSAGNKTVKNFALIKH
jgi:hypothetical protein